MATVKNIFFNLHRDQFTGKVILKIDQVHKSVFFRKGNPIFVDSTIRSETLGQMLLEQKRITEEQYRSILDKMQSSGRRQGEIIVELGFLSGFEVYEALQSQADRKLQNCFLLEGADITTEEGEEILVGVPELPIDFFRNFLDSSYATLFPTGENPFPKNRALKLKEKAASYLSTRKLRTRESKLVHLLDGKRTLDQVLSEAMGDPDEDQVFVEILQSMEFIELVDLPPQRFTRPASQVAKEKAEPPAAEEAAPREEGQRRVVHVESEKPPPKEPSSPIYAWALRLDRPYFELLKVNTTTNRAQIRRQYEKVVLELHLDLIDENYKDREKKVAEKVLDKLTLAVTVLCDDKRKHAYMQSMGKPPGGEKPDPEIAAEVCAQKALLYKARKNWAPAEEELQKAMELAPKEPSYHVELAELYLHKAIAEKTGIPETVEKELKNALKLDSQNEQAYFQMGLLAKLRNDLDRARVCFTRVNEIRRNHPQASAELRLLARREEVKKKGESALLKLFKKK